MKHYSFYVRYFFIFIILTVISVNIFAQSEMEYANYLMDEKDYFRAISEYKKLFYFSNDIETKNECLLKISKSYLKSNKFKSSIRFSSRLLNRPNISMDQFNKSNNYIGLCYYGLKVFPMAEDFFNKAVSSDTTGFSLFYLALLDVEKSNYREASKKYSTISKNSISPELIKVSEQLSSDVLKGYKIKSRNSYIASFLSTILPGSGQIYCKHYYDGIQSFLYVGAFAFATYASYKYDKKFNNNYINTYITLSITSLFHIGNIIGAERTATYYNLKQKQNLLDEIREKVFSIDY